MATRTHGQTMTGKDEHRQATWCEALDLQKRGLMQKLLTGKVRVNVAWTHGRTKTNKDRL